MKFYAAIMMMIDVEKNKQYRQQHIDFLTRQENEGKIFARGRFTDGTGGLVIYIAESYDEAIKTAEADPYVTLGARSLELYEWDMKVPGNQ
jgi:uncharacterized protein YciI